MRTLLILLALSVVTSIVLLWYVANGRFGGDQKNPPPSSPTSSPVTALTLSPTTNCPPEKEKQCDCKPCDTKIAYTPKPRMNAAFIILAANRHSDKLIKCITSIFEMFNKNRYYPIIIIYDEDEVHRKATTEIAKALSKEDYELIRYEKISFEFPKTWNRTAVEETMPPHFDEGMHEKTGIVWKEMYPGYQHMIAFWWKHIWNLQFVKDLDYYWRMDADAYLENPINYDVFEFMKVNNYVYGYANKRGDAWQVCMGLMVFVTKFIKKYNLTVDPHLELPKDAENEPRFYPWLYYNNFEIVDIKGYTSNEILRNFTDEVYETNAIYQYRWGDAPLRYYGLNVAFPKERMHHFCDVSYWHYSSMPNSCTLKYEMKNN